MSKAKTVFVGLSGGVDSSVAAARLLARGYHVVGVFIKVWHPEFMVCNWEAERLDAMRVAARLGIPFLTCDAEAEYRDQVARYFIAEYKAGRTPNPDVMCNQHVKFGAFLRFAKARGADYIATGHYAQRVDSSSGTQLLRGVDSNKDQTYFLWTLSKEQLQFSLFPIGDTPKEEIRREAATAGLPTATKKDSQGICFLGHVDIAEFLSHYVDLKPGPVLNEAGAIVGEHKGALVYTLGQRHGFTYSTNNTARPGVFVVDKDVSNNTITVAEKKPVCSEGKELKLTNVVLRYPLQQNVIIEAQTRYRQTPFPVRVTAIDQHSITLTPQTPTEPPTPGQSCVLYQAQLCLGGGNIK